MANILPRANNFRRLESVMTAIFVHRQHHNSDVIVVSANGRSWKTRLSLTTVATETGRDNDTHCTPHRMRYMQCYEIDIYSPTHFKLKGLKLQWAVPIDLENLQWLVLCDVSCQLRLRIRLLRINNPHALILVGANRNPRLLPTMMKLVIMERLSLS